MTEDVKARPRLGTFIPLRSGALRHPTSTTTSDLLGLQLKLYLFWIVRRGKDHPRLVTVTDAFVLTAYLTDRVKKGVLLWPTDKNT